MKELLIKLKACQEAKEWAQYPDMVDIKFELIREFRGFMRQKYIRDYNLEINVNNG